MKTAFLILCLILTCSATRAENVILESWKMALGRDKVFDDHLDFSIPLEELKKVHFWEPGSEKDVPFTRNQALELAQKAVLARGLEMPDRSELKIFLRKIDLTQTNLSKKLPQGYCHWYYIVYLKENLNTSQDLNYVFLVSMSGALASKIIRPNQ